jgi:hypothetical protein
MSINPMYLYVARLEDGEKVAEYVTNFPPPAVGRGLNLKHRGNYENFEVIKIGTRALDGYEIVVLTVRPVNHRAEEKETFGTE